MSRVIADRDPDSLASWATRAEFGPAIAALGWSGETLAPTGEMQISYAGSDSGYEVPVFGASPGWADFVRRVGLEVRVIDMGFGESDGVLVANGQIVARYRDRLSEFDRVMSTVAPIIASSIFTAGLTSAFAPALTAAGVPAGAVPGASRVAAGAALSLVQTGKVNPEALARTAAMQALGPGAGAARGVAEMGDDFDFFGPSNGGVDEGWAMDSFTDFDGQTIYEDQDFYGTAATEERAWIPERDSQDFYGTAATEDRGWVPSPIPAVSTTPTTPPALPPITPPQPPAPASSDWSFDTLTRNVTSAALSAISVVRAWEARKLPVNTTARSTDAQGNIVLARSDGLLYTRSSTGQVTAARPPVGLPQTTVDGYIVVNNGDGTFSKVSPTGSTTQERYGTMPAPAAGGVPMSGMAGMNQATMLYLAGAAALFLILRK